MKSSKETCGLREKRKRRGRLREGKVCSGGAWVRKSTGYGRDQNRRKERKTGLGGNNMAEKMASHDKQNE